MKKLVVCLVFAGLSTLFVSGQKNETRSVSGFTGIDASSVFNITVSKGSQESLIIEADEAIMQYVRSEVKNGVLHLYLDKDIDFKKINIKKLNANIVMSNLDKLSLSGACKFNSEDLFTSEKFSLKCSGASKVAIKIATGALDLNASGASNIQIDANVTGNAKYDVSGTTKISGELKANDVIFDFSGVVNIELTGSANSAKIDISGSSNIKAENFIVKTANIDSSGASKVTLHVTDEMSVNSTGASSINYKGKPATTLNISGASKIKSL